MSEGDEMLKTIGEAGGIGVIVLVVLGSVIKLIQRNGCTAKMYNCSGKPLVEVDCEKGAPTERFKPTEPNSVPKI